MSRPGVIDSLTGALSLLVTLLVMLWEWTGAPALQTAGASVVAILILVLFAQIGWTRRVFVLVGAALLVAAVATRTDWAEITTAALASAAFIAAFFTALASLRNASAGSEAVRRCGRFLADQPPGRRYLALTVGGHLFALILSYGAISLLGGLAEASARREPNLEIRAARIRRMLLAVQRGFVSTLAWSPLAFAMAISTSLVPGAEWKDVAAPCLVSALSLAGAGWTLDTIFKPRLSVPVPPRAAPEGSWATLLPLLGLLAILVAAVGGLHVATGVRTVGVVMLVVPLVSLAWVAIQSRGPGRGGRIAERVGAYIARDLPGYRSELALLVMAGFIGTLGARLSAPLIAGAGFDLSNLPAWQVLLAAFWLIPVAGQLGMNPILSVSLMAPLLPSPEALGVSPAAVIVAITGGWALGGASSPFTATTMLVGSFGGVSALHVGMRWNGLYTLTCGVILSAWAILYAYL